MVAGKQLLPVGLQRLHRLVHIRGGLVFRQERMGILLVHDAFGRRRPGRPFVIIGILDISEDEDPSLLLSCCQFHVEFMGCYR